MVVSTTVYLCIHVYTFVYKCRYPSIPLILVYTCVYLCLLVYTNVDTRIYLFIPVHTCVYICTRAYTHVYLFIPVLTCVYKFRYPCVLLYTCVTCLCLCIHVHIVYSPRILVYACVYSSIQM